MIIPVETWLQIKEKLVHVLKSDKSFLDETDENEIVYVLNMLDMYEIA